jgi:hypothetical protein
LENALKIPKQITITISTGGKPLVGVPVNLVFLMKQKNHHSFVFGPSDVSGQICVTNDEIKHEARKTMELFLMDYADIEAHWTGTLHVTPMNREAIKRALSAYRQFRTHEFPPHYEEMLLSADSILSGIPTATLEASVRCEPHQRLTIETVPAQTEESFS